MEAPLLQAASRWCLNQRPGDRLPFLLECRGCRRPLGAAVPVAGIREGALLAMEIGVHPAALGVALLLLGAVVRLRPIAPGVPPPRLSGIAQARRRGGGGKRLLEGSEVHGLTSIAMRLGFGQSSAPPRFCEAAYSPALASSAASVSRAGRWRAAPRWRLAAGIAASP